MDMFFAEVEATDAVPLRRRLHFNAAMLEASVTREGPASCNSYYDYHAHDSDFWEISGAATTPCTYVGGNSAACALSLDAQSQHSAEESRRSHPSFMTYARTTVNDVGLKHARPEANKSC